MTKIVQTELDSYYYGYPAGAAILTSNATDRSNAMSLAWHTTISLKPLQYGVLVSPQSFSHGLIVESGKFTINFMPIESAKLIAMVGGTSGRDIDKISEFQIATTPGSATNVPVLDDAYASYECTVIDRQKHADHDLFVGKVVAVQWEETAFRNDKTLDIEKISPAMYLGEDQYTTATQSIHHPRT